MNDIASCNLSFSKSLVFDPYAEVKALGSFILIDKVRNETVAAGMIKFALRRAENVRWQALAIDKMAQGQGRSVRSRDACGSPACPAQANRPSPTCSRSGCTFLVSTRMFSMATTFAMG